MSIEKTILSNLIYNEAYLRKVIPYIKAEYFQSKTEKVIFDIIAKYFEKYNRPSTTDTLSVDLDTYEGIDDKQFAEVKEIIKELVIDQNQSNDWLIDQTEVFCKDKALFLALMEAIQIVDNKKEAISRGAIPKLLSDALAVSFDTNVGHDVLVDWEKRFDFYHSDVSRVPFDLELMNKITDGGLPNKSLTVIMAGPYVGKSLFMAHFAASNLQDGKNVLYITMELSEENVGKRIDANLLRRPVAEINSIEKSWFGGFFQKLQKKTKGKIIIKEYPTGGAGSGHFRHLLNELKIKKNFIPDIIYIDYLNICCSTRIKGGGQMQMYSYVKAIAEEIRGLAVEFDLPIVTATQSNRAGASSSDPEMSDVAESFGIAATADLMLVLICNEEMMEKGKIMVKQIKNRFADMGVFKKFKLGINRLQFLLYDIPQDGEDADNNDEEGSVNFFRPVKKVDTSKFEGIA